ncbi:MAG: polysaccharide deacetylase family protein [Bacteroidetes bacterium]|jgi:alpha-amylase|nr:polysaccharide deacetylase family protein [Bacteroidota bacterium]MBT3747462.1 polysaccharide deacetylase family protein [Bacteroidota bacterium]MBT4401465.1 polysaccharide deacetylase family protein [Bacteroidota bacterium]MBT4408579.1 polysaccharide deacetylase family protein [Bacteroidota bacterium]MBT5424633.1 polysaccharide deacetylase family protein [Bacteroidota bacterium]
MKSICLYFQIHQPFRLKNYRFFEIGADHYYFDDYTNQSILRKVARKSYLPANQLFLKLIEQFPGRFKISFSITGIALDQFALYAPELIDSFKELAATGQVEFLAETYSHSLVSLSNEDEFQHQVMTHSERIEELFGMKPKVFRNTELIYSDQIGEQVYRMGFKAMLTEGAKHILGWKSPNFLYYNVHQPKLKLLLRNFKLSDDLAFRFTNQEWSEWPLTADKYVDWIKGVDENEDVINLFMDYETFGEHQSAESGIFEFLKEFPKRIIEETDFEFLTPSEVVKTCQPIAPLPVPFPISWADEERDLSAWLGNELQNEAFSKLYSLRNDLKLANSPELMADWSYLQASDHFYYMCTKFFSDQAVHNYFNPYGSPYDAFINYMNVLSDFILRLEEAIDRDRYKGVIVDELDEEMLYEAIDRYALVLKRLRKRRTQLERNNPKGQAKK